MPKIVRFHETGGAEVLKVEDLPLATPGKGEVRLKVEAIGLENQDMITKLLPRLSDAFFKDLYVFIPQLIRRKIKLTTRILSERMQKVADKVFGPDILHKVIIVKVTDS